ncbi:MAG: selenide, water dikinase SelD, partial [Gammaproteobacteria bacterium]
TIEGFPRPKAGIFAVRQGPVLAENLKRAAVGRPLKSYRPQTEFLSLISTGGRHAIGSRGDFATQGWWVWRWKDWIDRRFMRKFVVDRALSRPARRRIEAPSSTDAQDMRCGGCGAKLGGDLLSRALARAGLTGEGEDAAVLRPVANGIEIQTIDGFRAMLDEPNLVGRIAAEHALNDIYAMGAQPRTAMAWVTVAHGADPLMEEDLYQVMAGAKQAFDAAGADIVGGHSGEGPELSVGFALSGTAEEYELWHKRRIAIDDALILTKPIGTGVVLSANRQARCRGDWLAGAIECMRQSNRAAQNILRDAGVRACTDVAGFGLLGHAIEMAAAAKLCVEIYPARVARLAGAAELVEAGVSSTLQPANERLLRTAMSGPLDRADTGVRLLLDPQTSGGLLATVRPDKAVDCVNRLRAVGYTQANVIGRVVPPDGDGTLCKFAREAEG